MKLHKNVSIDRREVCTMAHKLRYSLTKVHYCSVVNYNATPVIPYEINANRTVLMFNLDTIIYEKDPGANKNDTD